LVRRLWSFPLVAAIFYAYFGQAWAQGDPLRFCDGPPHSPDRPCPVVPHDILGKLNPGYNGLSPATQLLFDWFSWQSFVALNWPANPDGTPTHDLIGQNPGAPRIWEFFQPPEVIFHFSLSQTGVYQEASSKHVLLLSRMAKNADLSVFLQATHQPLIDRNLNFVLYDIRLNADEVAYIQANGLDTKQGQIDFKAAGKTVDFPSGFYADPVAHTGGKIGAIELKFAWRILDKEKDKDVMHRYYHTDAVIEIDAKHTQTGKPLTLHETVGLVGMHILHKTATEKFWIWSTFEHVDNTPRSLQSVNSIGTDPHPRKYSFYDPATLFGVDPNVAPTAKPSGSAFLWAAQAPYAAEYASKAVPGGGSGLYGTQVTRVYPIYTETENVNHIWHEKLREIRPDSVWANYELIGSQWATLSDFPPQILIPAPARLSNTTLETYIQPKGSCIDCHKDAKTLADQPADFSFQLGEAQFSVSARHTSGSKP
jgi:hypothetical protein